MQTEFTPLLSLGGGVLIGLSAVVLMLALGKVAGATGILSGALLPSEKGEQGWKAAFLVGMVSSSILFILLTGNQPDMQIPVSTVAIVIGGFIVGIGVTLGNGCTSGHGVCGMARLSMRSIMATLVFMLSTFVTVFIARHIMGGL